MYTNIEYFISPNPGIENVYIDGINSSEIQIGEFISTNIDDNPDANDTTYTCATCGTIFNKYDLYLDHLHSHIYKTTFECKKCNKTFDQINCYHKHIMKHQEDKLFSCSICHEGFNIENNFKVHMALHGSLSVCPICELSFQRMASLKSHLAIHQVEELIVCSECSSEFETEADLKKHIKTHSLDVLDQHRGLICSICKVKFETSILLKHHIKSHIKVKKLVLNGKRTNKIQMGNKEHKHKCTICSKVFPKWSLLERHTRIHSGERPYVCSTCDKGFSQKGTLQIHMTKHTGLKPFCCTLCPAKFNQKGNLKVHVQKTHTATTENEKIFKCSQCDCIFKKVASLNGHMTKIHATDTEEISIASLDHPKNFDKQLPGITLDSSDLVNPKSSENQLEMNVIEKLHETGKNSKTYSLKQKFLGTSKVYICSYCDKEIKKPSDLIRHLRTHTKEKPFKCFCGSSFSVKSTLSTHMQIHKGKNGKKCTVCSKVLFTLKAWNAHLRKHESSSENTVLTIHNNQDEELVENSNRLNSSERSLDVQQRPVSLLKKANLKRLMQLHSWDRNHKCRVCQRSFTSTVSLKEHMKLHSDVRKFDCETCNKVFSTKSLLKRHMSIHNTQKPYECFYCRKKFKNMLMCGRHIISHENIAVKQDIIKASMCYAEEDVSVDSTKANVSESTPLLEVNPDEILDNLFDSDSPKITEECANADVSEHVEKYTTTTSTMPLGVVKNEELQTFFVDCSTRVHDDEDLPNNLFSHLDLQPTNIIDLGSVNEIKNSPMVFKVQNLIGEASFPSVDMMNGELYINNSSGHIDSQETKSLLTSVENMMTSALNNTICMPNDISDNFLADNISLYPNVQIALDKSEEMSSTIPSNLIISQEDICLNSSENSETNALKSSNIINVSFEDSGGTTGNINIIHCSECRILFDDMTTYESHACMKPVLKNDSLDALIDLNKSAKTTAKCQDDKNSLKNKNKSQKPAKKRFTCVYCGKEFHSRGAYIRHANVHKKNDDGLHKCKFCLKKFKKPSDLSRHLRTHTGEKPYACDKCEKRFSLKSTLEGHYRTHNPGATKDFLCEVCNSFFTSKSSLKIHMHVHTGAKPHKCNYCDQHFRTLAHRRSHQQKMHSNNSIGNDQSKLISVEHSEHETRSEDVPNSNLHEEIEPTQLKIQLSEEGNQTVSDMIQIDEVLLQQLQNSNIIIEVLQDIDPKDQSPVIAIDGNSIGNLRLITEINKKANKQFSNEPIKVDPQRNLECEICHKKYASKDVFRKHMQLHSKNKFICELCNKWFSTVEALCEHEKLHLGHRPYPCFLCTNNFAELHHLKSHLKRIHQIEDTITANTKNVNIE